MFTQALKCSDVTPALDSLTGTKSILMMKHYKICRHPKKDGTSSRVATTMERSSCLGEVLVSRCSKTWNALTLVSIYDYTNEIAMCKSYSPAATGSWNALETFVDGCSHPKAHCGHASTSNDNIMYIHGGWPKDGQPSLGNFFEEFTAGLLSFDMATLTWKEVTPNYHQPPSGGLVGIPLPDNYMHLLRDHHSLEYVDGRLIMFGGRGALSGVAFAAV